MLKSLAVKNFLELASSPLARLYMPEMEVQCNVYKGEGKLKRDQEKEIYYELNEKSWKPFRIPNDSDINFDLMIHAEGIGLTGWNFVKKQSHWIGFDFDSIVNHKAGLTEEELQSVIYKANQIEYVSIYKSTSGKGLHLYIFFDKPFPTIDRAEHQALAQAMLSFLTADSGFDFNAAVDCLGMILWVWHRKQEGTDGLTLIKEGSKFPSQKIPSNWKKYLNEKREVSKMKYSPEMESLISSNQLKVLTESQKSLLKWFTKNSRKTWWYDTDAKMLVCHTLDLVTAHEDLNLKGKFSTESTGSTEQNCFLFPYRGDSWIVRRYGKHVKESSLWETDDLGWTKTFYNLDLNFKQAALYRGAVQNSKGHYIINGSKLKEILTDLNVVPPQVELKQDIELSLKPQGIVIQTDESVNDWLTNKKGGSEKVIQYQERTRDDNNTELFFLDDLVRHCIVEDNELGWVLNANNTWIHQSPSNIPKVIQYKYNDINSKSLNINQGMCIMNPWRIVCEPFKPEYPGNRTWNKDSAQLAFTCEQGSYETWSSVLEHLSYELKPQEHFWCAENGIVTGHDYLLFWIASMFQRPEISLPYLFFWGKQNTGKSTLHENLKMFFKNGVGYVRADHTLRNSTGFNGELKNSILAVIEETSLNKNPRAEAMIKDFVTSDFISIRALYCQPVLIRNTSHWIQVNNYPDACPVSDGDTRIVSANVPELEKEIPKGELKRRLEKEAPAFLHKLLNLQLPLPFSRLGLPVLDTKSKQLIQRTNNKEPLDIFLYEKCYLRFGQYVLWSDFYNRFDLWLAASFSKERSIYTKHKTVLLFQNYLMFPKGKYSSYICLGNLSFSDKTEHKKEKFVELEGRLVLKELNNNDHKLLKEFLNAKEIL